MSSFHFYRYNQFKMISLGCTLCTRNLSNFWQRPILGKPSTPRCSLADRHGRKADLNWKLKISNTADNGDINQSQVHDNRNRQMQK